MLICQRGPVVSLRKEAGATTTTTTVHYHHHPPQRRFEADQWTAVSQIRDRQNKEQETGPAKKTPPKWACAALMRQRQGLSFKLSRPHHNSVSKRRRRTAGTSSRLVHGRTVQGRGGWVPPLPACRQPRTGRMGPRPRPKTISFFTHARPCIMQEPAVRACWTAPSVLAACAVPVCFYASPVHRHRPHASQLHPPLPSTPGARVPRSCAPALLHSGVTCEMPHSRHSTPVAGRARGSHDLLLRPTAFYCILLHPTASCSTGPAAAAPP